MTATGTVFQKTKHLSRSQSIIIGKAHMSMTTRRFNYFIKWASFDSSIVHMLTAQFCFDIPQMLEETVNDPLNKFGRSGTSSTEGVAF